MMLNVNLIISSISEILKPKSEILHLCFFQNDLIIIIICCCYLVVKSYSTLCSPMDDSPAGSSVHGISQARTPE